MSIDQAGFARPITAFSLAAFAAFIVSPACAHVTLANPEATPNRNYRAVLQVPHGCDGAATRSVRVQIPEGAIAVKPMPKAGWTLTTTRGPLAKSYENHGRAVTEGVKEIVWSGGELPDEHFDEFIFTATVATDGGPARTVYFPTTQKCATGEVAWSEIPSGSQTARDLKKPAPSLRIATAVAQATTGAASADTVKVGNLTVTAAWTRATPGGAKVAGGYLKVTNNGATADRLLGGNADIAGRVEIHEMATRDGVMRMRPLDGGLEIKPGQTVELTPGGLHVMFLDLKRQLTPGEVVKATLRFEKAGTAEVAFPVGAVGGAAAPQQHHH